MLVTAYFSISVISLPIAWSCGFSLLARLNASRALSYSCNSRCA